MKVNIKLWGQLKQLTNKEVCNVSLNDNKVESLIQQLALDEKSIAHFLVNSSNEPSSSTLVFINGQQHVWGTTLIVKESDDITLMSPIAGG